MRRFSISAALLLAALLVSLPALSQDVISTAIGGGPNGIPAIDANLYNPVGVAVDTAGNYYIASYNQHRVFKVSTAGTITVVAGSGAQGFAGDGVTGGAGNASLYHPYAVAVDSANNVYIADQYNCVIRKVDSTKTITTIAGTPNSCSYSGDGGKATLAQIYYPQGLGLDASGNLYIGDDNNCVVRKVILATNIISTVAGNHTCGYTGDGGSATAAELSTTSGVQADSAGNLYIADSGNCVIRKVTKATNKISTIAGNHTCAYNGDGGLATSAEMNQIFSLAVNGAGTTVTIGDYYNQRVRQFTVGGNISTVAGNGTPCSGTCGEGGPATSAEFNGPSGVAATSGGTIYVANYSNYVIDSFSVGGNLNLAAGNHSNTIETLITNEPPQGVVFDYPYGVFNDSAGNVYVGDSQNNMVRELVKSSNLVNFFAGNGTYGFSGDGGSATLAELRYPYGVAKDKSGNVYIADYYNCLIRVVNSAGNISTFAGLVVSGNAGQCGYTGDGGPATGAKLNSPYGLAVDSKGNVYFADYSNNVVREVTTGGTITTIAGIGGIAGYGGDGGLATNALLYNPTGVAVDPTGNVFISDYNNCRIREINAGTGIITTVAGNGTCSYTGDGQANSNGIQYPLGVAVDANDNLFFTEYYAHVRWVSPSGVMTTIAGTGTSGYNGDGMLATLANLYIPIGITLDSAGDVLFADSYNFRVRSISAFPAVSTSVGNLAFGLTAVGTTSSPQQFAVSALGPVTISNIAASNNFSEADNCPSAMANGTTCTMYVYFTPTASGTLNGNVTINHNGFFNQINNVSVTGLGTSIAISGAPLAYGNQLVKTTSAAKAVTVTNNGTTAVTMGVISITNATDYAISANTCPASGSTLAAKASCSISITFGPKSTGVKRGTLVINDNDPASPQLVGLSGNGISKVTLSPTQISFAVTPIGVTSAAQKITVTNTTGVSITLGNPAITVTGPFVNAATTTCTNSLVIANNGTCVINVNFKPTVLGYVSGSISISDSDVTSPQSVPLQGYGTGIKFTPASVNFGTVNRGTQVSSTVTITNVGTKNVAFTGGSLKGTNSADFADNYSDSPPCGNTVANPLKPGATCQITVYFLPTKVGTENASYQVFDNSVGSPQTLGLTGKGQ
jgi:trimeric autotransporter adhesin